MSSAFLHRTHRASDQREFIIQQLPRKVPRYLGPEILQLATRRGVEGLRLYAGHTHGAQTIAHLSGCPRREGHREHALRAHKPLVYQVGDAISAELAPYTGATGKETTLQDTVFTTIPGSPAYPGKAASYVVNASKYGFSINLKDHNSVQGSFRFVA